MSYRVKEVWAFLSTDADDVEGIIGANIGPDGMFMPFVCADQARVDSLRPMAKAIGEVSGQPVTLAHFQVRDDVEVIHG